MQNLRNETEFRHALTGRRRGPEWIVLMLQTVFASHANNWLRVDIEIKNKLSGSCRISKVVSVRVDPNSSRLLKLRSVNKYHQAK